MLVTVALHIMLVGVTCGVNSCWARSDVGSVCALCVFEQGLTAVACGMTCVFATVVRVSLCRFECSCSNACSTNYRGPSDSQYYFGGFLTIIIVQWATKPYTNYKAPIVLSDCILVFESCPGGLVGFCSRFLTAPWNPGLKDNNSSSNGSNNENDNHTTTTATATATTTTTMTAATTTLNPTKPSCPKPGAL